MSLRAERPQATTNLHPEIQARALSQGGRSDTGTSTGADHFVAQSRLWGALHERLGHAGVAQLLSDGPQTALDLQILHVAGFVESTGIDATSYLPWNAPLAWQGRTQPYYQVLLQSLLTQHGQAPGLVGGGTDNLSALSGWWLVRSGQRRIRLGRPELWRPGYGCGLQ